MTDNVIQVDFGRRPDPVLPDIEIAWQLLYMDEHAMLARITYRIGGKEFIQHVCAGAGIG